MEPSRIGLVGAGWRTEAYFRVARARPDLFTIAGALVRSEARADRIAAEEGIAATTSPSDFQRRPFDYVIVCVPREAAPAFTRRFALADIPVLSETPLAQDLPSTTALYRELGDAPVQVAEQYRYQPHHAARLSVASSGILGRVGYIRSSVAHDYHAMSLIRRVLGVGSADARISAHSLRDRSISTLSSAGWAADPAVVESERISARLQFADGSVADYDFSDEQYFSPIRSRSLTVRGERGEIVDDRVRYLSPDNDPVSLQLTRQETGVDGDLEGRFLRSITLGPQRVFDNPLAPARLSDDEIAIGTVLLQMNEYARTRQSFYGVADAAQDHYLALAVLESARTGREVATSRRPWAEAVR